MCPSNLPAVFSFALPTHASGSRLILQRVSDRLPARHVVLVIALLAQMCDAGWQCTHVPSD